MSIVIVANFLLVAIADYKSRCNNYIFAANLYIQNIGEFINDFPLARIFN